MEENETQKLEKKPEKKRKWLPKFAVAALLILIVGASLSGNNSTPTPANNSTQTPTNNSAPPQRSAEELRITAYVMSQDFLNDQLKSPATAKYPLMREITVIDQGDGVYVVKAYVDAENSFGAKIRTQYTATVQNTEGELWKLLNLQVE